ncbi:MAG: LPS-assembly protein LptD [Bacteroidales bacterium]|nr:LPS-assembly protein LptD [Bacteroidales bacterium]
MAQDIPQTDSTDNVVPTDSIASDSLSAAKPPREAPFKSRVLYKAIDSMNFFLPEQKVFMYNEGKVEFEKKVLDAYRIQFDMATKIVHADPGKDSADHDIGVPKFVDGSQTIHARSLSYNFNNSKGFIHEIKTQEGEGYLHASKAKRYADGHIDLAGGKYTTCDADHPHFHLALSKAKVIPGDQVVFGPAHMVLLDIPLPIIIPFGFFPQSNKKAVSGVLMPSIGMEVSRGLSATNGGYYFSFSDHFDATVRGDIYSTGTWKLDVAPRYMKRYKFSGNMNFNYGVTVSGEKGLDRSETKQYSIQWSHTQDAKANPNQTFSASVNYSSTSYDREFNYTNPSMLYTNTKNSSISYRKNWPNTPFRLTANFNHSQSQNSGVEMITFDFPTVAFSMDRIYPFRKKESSGKAKWYEDITLQYDANLKNTLTGKEGDLFTPKNFKRMKNGFQHKVPFSINFKALKFLNITPSMNYNGVLYNSRIRRTYLNDSISSSGQRGIVLTDTIYGLTYAHSLSPSLSISANSKFYLMNIYGPNSKIEAIRTVISPTASINYVPDMSSLFNYYRTYIDNAGREQKYSMYDGSIFGTPTSPGQSGSVSVGLNGNVEMKVRSDKDTTGISKKVKILDRIDARSSYNIFADSMKWSNVSLSASTTIAGINFTVTGAVDPYKLTPAGTRIDRFGPRLTNVNFNTGITLPFSKGQKSGEETDNKEKGKTKSSSSNGYDYFNVPWNLTVSYSMNYSKPTFEGKFTQNLNFSGSITLTPKWSLNFQSAYDFDAKKISYMTATIQRDLHCWTMSLNFAPFGSAKYFFFQINVKSGTLRDLKYEKRRTQQDFSINPW